MQTVSFDDATQFFIENDPASAEQALQQAGSFVQVYPARPQLVMVETAAGKFDEHKMPEKGGRGGANKHSANAIYLGENDKGLIFKIQRDGVWQEETVTRPMKQRKTWLDGKIIPSSLYSLKPGRRCWLATYRSGDALMILYMSTRKGEIDGTVSKIDGQTITLTNSEIDPEAGEQTITLDAAGSVLVDGIAGDASAIAVGQYLRVFRLASNRLSPCRVEAKQSRKFGREFLASRFLP